LSYSTAKIAKVLDLSSERIRQLDKQGVIKEVNAHVVGLQNGILSLQDVATSYGRDVEDVFRSVEREKELAARYGVTLGFEPFGATTQPTEPVLAGDD